MVGVIVVDDSAAFRQVASSTFADVLNRDQVMDVGIRALWPGMPRIAGPAYTVGCVPGDSLMLHAAIYRAAPGCIIVVQSGDVDFAVAGGNVCAIAQERGVAGFVVDGVIRDIAEVRERGFGVFGRGVVPIAGTKRGIGSLCGTIRCGRVLVSQGDMVVGDEEGVVVVPGRQAAQVLAAAQARTAAEAARSLEEWEADHRRRIEAALELNGFHE